MASTAMDSTDDPHGTPPRQLRYVNRFNAENMWGSPPSTKVTAKELRHELWLRGLPTTGTKAKLSKRMKAWTQFSVQEIRDELKRRGLDCTGSKSDIRNRLEQNNAYALLPRGQHEIHLRKLADFKQASLDKIVPCQHFQKLPAELRIMIWRFALPGPRVLNTGCSEPDKLIFPKKDNQDNPALLSVCQQSRKVALEKYRLVFGTSNVYADLSCDILYLGSGWAKHFDLSFPWRARSDLQAIKNVALHPYCWHEYMTLSWTMRNGRALRDRIKKTFPSIEKLLLVKKNEGPGGFFWANFPTLSSFTPGHIHLERTHQTKSFRRFWMDFSSDTANMGTILQSPKLQFVEVARVLAIPGDDWDYYWGEPYVSTVITSLFSIADMQF